MKLLTLEVGKARFDQETVKRKGNSKSRNLPSQRRDLTSFLNCLTILSEIGLDLRCVQSYEITSSSERKSKASCMLRGYNSLNEV